MGRQPGRHITITCDLYIHAVLTITWAPIHAGVPTHRTYTQRHTHMQGVEVVAGGHEGLEGQD